MANSNFTVETFKNEDGTTDPNKIVVKLRRGTIHPGVMFTFMTNAFKLVTDDLMMEAEKHFSYKRGTNYHMWIISPTELEELKAHFASFEDPAALQEHFKSLRAHFPAVTPKEPVSELLDAAFDSTSNEEEN